MKLLGVVPAFNEADRIGGLVTRLRPHCAAVLAVDDGSADDTAGQARDAGATVEVHKENRGKGAAIRTAFAYAEENGFDAVIMTPSPRIVPANMRESNRPRRPERILDEETTQCRADCSEAEAGGSGAGQGAKGSRGL